MNLLGGLEKSRTETDERTGDGEREVVRRLIRRRIIFERKTESSMVVIVTYIMSFSCNALLLIYNSHKFGAVITPRGLEVGAAIPATTPDYGQFRDKDPDSIQVSISVLVG